MFHIANKWTFTLSFFFIMAVFLPVQESVATTFRAVYADAPGTGFYDETPMTDQLARGDIRGTTVGDVRRNAFEAALDILEENISTNNNGGIIIQASFDDLGGQSSRGIMLGGAFPANHVYLGLVPGLPVCSASSFFQTPPQCSIPLLNEPGVVGVPIALAEHITGQGFNGNNADVVITFNERAPFYFGTGTEPLNYNNFILVAAHELFHGLGFSDSIQDDGSFYLTELNGSLVPVFSYYDINLYSESEGELLVNLSQSERRDAITSVDGLLWDGTLGGLFDTSCGRLMGKALMDSYPSAVDNEGRPQLYAPRPYQPGSSVSHFVEASKDLMKPTINYTEHADFTLGVLLDMLWLVGEVSPAQFEILGDCLADSEEESETAPEPTPAPDTSGQSSGGGSGGCTMAETQTMSQNTILNLLLILLTIVPCFQLYRRGG